MPPKRKGTTQATSPQKLVRLEEEKKAPAKDGGTGGKSKPAGGKPKPVGGKRSKQAFGRKKAPKQGDQIEPFVAETKPVRPSIPSDLERSIKEIAKMQRLKSPPSPQMPKTGHKTYRKSGEAGRKAVAAKKAQAPGRVKTAVAHDK
jgi:hypothetical protein